MTAPIAAKRLDELRLAAEVGLRMSSLHPQTVHVKPDELAALVEEVRLLRAKAAPASTAPACRKCGCTEADCSGCITRTGSPCYWIEPDLCSACGDGHPLNIAQAVAMSTCVRNALPGAIVLALDERGALHMGCVTVDHPVTARLQLLSHLIDSMIERTGGGGSSTVVTAPAPRAVDRAACIHCRQDVCAAHDEAAVRQHSLTCSKSPVVQEVQRMRSVYEQALVVAEHWTHDGINGTELDKLELLARGKCCANCGGEMHAEPEVGLSPGCPQCHWVSGRAIASRGELLDVIARLEQQLEEYSRGG